jgi:hypothetical protein
LLDLRRVGRHDFDIVTHRSPDGVERILDDVRHGQNRCPGVYLVAADIGLAHPPARISIALDDGDRASASGQLEGSRQPGQSGTYDDHMVGLPRDSAHQ